MKSLAWKDLRRYHRAAPQDVLPRQPEVQAAYDAHKASLATEGLTPGDHIRTNVLPPGRPWRHARGNSDRTVRGTQREEQWHCFKASSRQCRRQREAWCPHSAV